MYTKIRKNSAKKINALIAAATSITIETQSMGMDDCWNSNGDVAITAEEVHAFMEKNYSDLVVRLYTDAEGNNVKLTIADGQYYFCDEITIRFDSVEEVEEVAENAPEASETVETVKPKLTYAQVKEALEAGFVSPLNNDKKESTVAIKTVFIHWSESSILNQVFGCDSNFDIKKEVSVEEYERVAEREAADDEAQGYTGCYAKTKIDVYLSNGQCIQWRHDINAKNRNLDDLREYIAASVH